MERHEAESVMGEAWSLISEGERHEVESVRGKDMKGVILFVDFKSLIIP